MARDRNGLEYRHVDLEQFDWFDLDEIESKLHEYAQPIGEILIVFSDLEHILERSISFIINDRTDEIGLQITLHLGYTAKVELLNQLALRSFHFGAPDKKPALKEFKKRLLSAGEKRNIIAHAKWTSLTGDEYVRSSVKSDRDEGGIKFKEYKLTPQIVSKIATDMDTLGQELYDFLSEGTGNSSFI